MLTFGHSTLEAPDLTRLLKEAGVELLVDVRRYPASRNNPSSSREVLPGLLKEVAIDYRWEGRMGGRRTLSKEQVAESPDSWWEVPAFRAYADWTRSAEFNKALPELLKDDEERTTAIMCSESVWWRCHRRLISDVMMLGHGREVTHLMQSGTLSPHRVSEGARLAEDHQLIWDGH